MPDFGHSCLPQPKLQILQDALLTSATSVHSPLVLIFLLHPFFALGIGCACPSFSLILAALPSFVASRKPVQTIENS